MKAQMSVSGVSVDLTHMTLVCILKVSRVHSAPRDAKYWSISSWMDGALTMVDKLMDVLVKLV